MRTTDFRTRAAVIAAVTFLAAVGYSAAAVPATSFKEVQCLARHQGAVTAIAISPDGKTIASAGVDGTIRFWDLATGRERRRLASNPNRLMHVIFSPDGKYLASWGGDGTIQIWNVGSGRVIRRIGHASTALTAADYTADGKMLASVASDHFIRLWDASSGKEVRSWQQPLVQNVACSADGTTVASLRTLTVGSAFQGGIGGFGGGLGGMPMQQTSTVHFWDATTGKPRRPAMAGPFAATVQTMAFSPDGRTLALAGSQSVASHGFRNGLGGFNGGLGGLRGFGGGLGGLGGGLGGIGGGLGGLGGGLGALGGGMGKLQPMGFGGFGGMGGFGSGFGGNHGFQGFQGFSGQMHLSLCEVATGKARWQAVNIPGAVWSVAFAPDGNALATGMADNTIGLWETAAGKKLGQLTGHRGVVNAVAFTPDGKLLVSASADGTIRLWNVAGLRAAALRSAGPAPPRPANALWAELGEPDAARAGKALAALLGARGQAVSFLDAKLKALPRVDVGRIPRLIADLDDKRYRVRQHATVVLQRLGEQAGPALRRALAERPTSLEVCKRLEQLVARLDSREPAADDLRQVRALEILERLGTLEARKVLKDVAADVTAGLLASEARAALKRLGRRY